MIVNLYYFPSIYDKNIINAIRIENNPINDMYTFIFSHNTNTKNYNVTQSVISYWSYL